MRRNVLRRVVLTLLAFGSIDAAFADYYGADSYNGHFQFVTTELSLDQHWISWRFPNYDHNGDDDALKYSRWYVGGEKAGYDTYVQNPSEYFYTPFWQGAEILYMDRTYGITQRQNEQYGVGDVYNEMEYDGIRTHEVMFYPGEQMGPEKMKYFFVRWTGWWDVNDNGAKGYWMGQPERKDGESVIGSVWQGPGVRHAGNGIARYTQVTYNIPATKEVTLSRKPGGQIEASITGNDHKSWEEYYGFSDGNATDEQGYYTNAYGSAELSGGKATYTISGPFDETVSYTIYYHQYYKRSQTIEGQQAEHDINTNPEKKTVHQHFQAERIATVSKGFVYPSDLQVTQDKWAKSVKLTWKINNDNDDHNKDGGWLVFRQKEGETGVELVTSSRLNYKNSSYTDTDLETGAEYTYWVTFAPTSYGDLTAPIESALSCSNNVKHDNTFSFSKMNAELYEGENGGVNISWEPERKNSDVTFYVQRWNKETQDWADISSGQSATNYVDKDVESWEEYKYRIKTSYWNLDFYSEVKSICYTVMTTVNELKASLGTYGNMVKLNWTAEVKGSGSTRYDVYRKRLGDPQAVFDKIYEVVGSESTFYYEDVSALPGQYYDYKVTAYAKKPATENEPERWVEGNSKECDGFVQTRGVLTGRIKYGTGTAVQGVKVQLTKSEDNDDNAEQYYSLQLDGDSIDGIEWAPSDEVIKNYFTGEKRPWSIQLYVRPDAGMEGTHDIFDVNGYAGLGVQPSDNGYELQVKSANAGDTIAYSATGVIIPTDKYSHLVFSYDGANTYTVRVIMPNTKVEFVEGKQLMTLTERANVKFDDKERKGAITFGASGFKGYIDELRIWTKALSDEEIIACYDRVLACTEQGLLCYWPLDEGINGLSNVYDYSKNNGIANGNHGVMLGSARISGVVPDGDQLSLYGVTDKNGNYVIRGVPFSGEGTTYVVRPVMGIHEFNPSYHTRYVSNNTLTHDDISFEDVSSFPVSGVVYYENTTYPVQGCVLYVDGNACTKEGKLIETDEEGRFEISVPIGDHSISIEKNGHTFVGDGRYPTGVGEKYTFESAMSNLTFYDNTLVHIAGRVVGGDIEGEKSIGFGLSQNNIGMAQLVLTPTNDKYSLNAVKKVNGTVISYENNSETLACAAVGDMVNSNSWRGSGDNAGRIYIQTDAATGEFSAMVPPLVYNVTAPIVIKTNETVGGAGLIDVTNPLAVSSDTLVDEEGVETLFEYNTKYKCTYHSEPSFTVTQSNFSNGAFGIAQYSVTDEVGEFVVDIVNEEGTPEYTYGTPFFISGDPYTFKLKGFEQYTNHDGEEEVVTTVPLENCVVTIFNALSDGQAIVVQANENDADSLKVGDVVDLESNQLTLDEKGEATYTWRPGYANITAPYTRTISMTYEVGGQVNAWKIDGKESMEGVVLGSLPTGSNFVTMGPDKLLMVLRDPPGSGSSAEWTSGTVTVKEETLGNCWTTETTIRNTASFGGDVTLVNGIGVATMMKTDTQDDLTFGAKVVSEGENATTKSHSLTVTQTISTSDDPSMVGSLGDVFIGQSTNLLFGKAREVGFTRNTDGDIELGVQDIISVGSTFSTYFSYTGYYIENYLLPNLEMMRNDLLISLSEADYKSYVNNTDGLKFITTLSPDDPRFGSNNSDEEVWGDLAVAHDSLEGPSYKVVLPQRLLEQQEYEIDETINVEQDSIYQYNLQISNWIKHLAANEEEKVKAWEDRDNRLLKNYSFDGGASVSYSYETDATFVQSHEHNSGAIAILGNVLGIEINGLGWEFEQSTETGGTRHEASSESESEVASFAFNLVESGDDALSVDVYNSPYSYIFRTRAGQTSAPYEAAEYTKYYKPGTKLHEATMQIEVPDIEVEVATVSNITSGSAASYTLLLTNKSEIDCDLYYKLLQMDETNPNGAQLSIDGVPLSDNRVIKVPAGEVVRKTLLLKQSNLGILDYENIGIVLASQEQGDPTGVFPQIADTVYVSAYYVPSSSPVKMELNRTLLNTSSGTNLNITFNSFDRNYYNLKAFRIQYMKQGDTDWTLLKEYLVKVEGGQQLSSIQELLPETADVTYTLDMNSFADGKYTFRVLSASTYGTGESTLVTDAIEITKDMSRPMVFGTPKPTTGFLGMGDDIEITFNEDINSGRLTSTGNFLVTAALNGAAVAHDVALLATDSEEAVAKTEADINLIGKSFSVDLWVRINGEGTIFSHGNGENKLTFGVKEEADKYYFCVNGQVISDRQEALPANKWIYMAFSLDQEDADSSRFTALYANDAESKYLAYEEAIEKYEGYGRVALGQGFNGAIHEVALWDEAIDVQNLQAQMHDTKKPTTEHLIGYWKLNEGLGTQAKDLARNRHMNVTGNWYLNNINKGIDLTADSYAVNYAVNLNISECAMLSGDDYAIEMWFRAEENQEEEVAYLFDVNNINVTMTKGKLTLNAGSVTMGMGSKSYDDGVWHHMAINVLRNGNTITYIDGESVGQVASAGIPALSYDMLTLGAKCERGNDLYNTEYTNRLKGNFDEIRIWNATLNAQVIRDRMRMRLNGTEAGLVAYYPFEKETLDANSQIVTEVTPLDMVSNRLEAYVLGDGEIAYGNEAPALKPVSRETNVSYNFVASDRGIVIELGEDADRLEGTTVNITVKDVLDLNGNKSQPVTWTALVKRNQLLWFDDELDVEGSIGEEKVFTAIITNQSAQTEHWVLNDLPSWLSANFTSGSLPALGNQEITFTVDASAPTGKSEFTIYMSGNNAILVPLTVNMNLKAEAPEWSVDPYDYESVATLLGVVKIDMGMDKEGAVRYAFSEDEDDLVAAFIDGRCAGLTNVMYDSHSDSYRVFLTIYGNTEDEGKTVSLQVWDASTGTVHPIVEVFPNLEASNGTPDTLRYSTNATWGDFDNAYGIFATRQIQQSTPLKKNWNWISVYVDKEHTGANINTVLSSISPNGRMIKSQNRFNEYLTEDNMWYEDESDEQTLNNVSPESMYKLQMNDADTLVVSGYACSKEQGITLGTGWSWIPYLRSFDLSLDDAFAGFEPTRNDQVKGQEGFAMYNGTTWSGTLKSLSPGKGYIYYNTAEEDKYGNYPTDRAVAAASLATPRRQSVEPSMFSPVAPTDYESNMTILAVVKDGDKTIDAREIAVFDGAICMAATMAEEDGLFYLTIPGDKTVTDRLTVYAVVGDEVIETSTSFHFKEDATFGDFDKPFAVNVRKSTKISDLLIEGAYRSMRVVDLMGRVLYTGVPASLDESSLHDGQYILELTTEDGQIIYIKQSISRKTE